MRGLELCVRNREIPEPCIATSPRKVDLMDGGNYIAMASRLQAMQVYCPECGAAIDEACLLAYERKGRVYRRACHSERHQLYQKNRGVRSLARIARENADLIRGDVLGATGD